MPSISIHALLAESDIIKISFLFRPSIFLSTLSLRRATNRIFHVRSFTSISIHALLAESDWYSSASSWLRIYFYPRSPCGERPVVVGPSSGINCISIHALLAESDNTRSQPSKPRHLFLSTLSLRRATAKVHKTVGHFCAYETNFMGIASSC